ncbi:hypothetical protein [Clostridium sp.]|uniref:hypothetical protein n=1 Tax=Clostridium sp. TaxID=1506 RepID=UPI003F67A1AD
MDIGGENRYVLVGMTILIGDCVVQGRGRQRLLYKSYRNEKSEDVFPEEYVPDNGKEFVSSKFELWGPENDIKH